MKINTALFNVAIVCGLALASTSSNARQTTGFASFRISGSYSTNPYSCLTESLGAVVNKCAFNVNLVFGLPIDNQGTHSITVNSYWGSKASFTCDPYAYPPWTLQGNQGIGGTFFTGDPTTGFQITTTVNVPEQDESIQLICWNVPPGAGIAKINWAP